jgi:hypothetical protein
MRERQCAHSKRHSVYVACRYHSSSQHHRTSPSRPTSWQILTTFMRFQCMQGGLSNVTSMFLYLAQTYFGPLAPPTTTTGAAAAAGGAQGTSTGTPGQPFDLGKQLSQLASKVLSPGAGGGAPAMTTAAGVWTYHCVVANFESPLLSVLRSPCTAVSTSHHPIRSSHRPRCSSADTKDRPLPLH